MRICLLTLGLGLGASLPARAANATLVSLGTRDDFTERALGEGLDLGLRRVGSRWGWELAAYGRLRPVEATPLTEILLTIAAATEAPLVAADDLDRAALRALASWGPRGVGRWSGGPVLLGGLEARLVQRSAWVLPDGDASRPVEEAHRTALFGAGPVAGLGFEGHLGSPLVVRLAVLDRTWVGPERIWEGDGVGSTWTLQHDPTATLDLAWEL